MQHIRALDADSLRPNLIAPCGMDCGVCSRTFRLKDACPGCRSTSPKPRYCDDCAIRQCDALPNGPGSFCFECATFPCARLKRLDTRYRTRYRTSLLENLRTIQELGLERFVDAERHRWTCTSCGALMSIHKDYCPACKQPL